MTIEESTTRLTASDGFELDAHRATPRSEPRGGLVILQEIFGVTDQLKSVARTYASEGFDCTIPALFDRAAPGTVVPFDTPDRGRELMASLDEEKVMRDIAAAVAAVDGGRGVSLLGFCWGGGLVLKSGGELEITSGVAYYGTRLTQFLGHPPRCPLLFHFGESDTHSPPEVISAVREAIPDAEIHVYAAGHAFANDTRSSYVPEAAIAAGVRTREFLERHHPA